MITYNTHEDYKLALEKLSQYDAAANKYRADNKTNGIPIEICASFPFASEVSNEMRSAIEVYEFINTPPNKYFLYINEKEGIAMTWTGQKLGRVTFGQTYRSNLGDKRQSVSIWAINGHTYYGTYYKSSGNYARIKMRKSAP